MTLTPRGTAAPNQTQRNTLMALLVTAIVFTALCLPLAVSAVFDGIPSLFNTDRVHSYTGEPRESIFLGNLVRFVFFLTPFLLSLTLSIVLARKRKHLRLTPAAVRAERTLFSVASGLSFVFALVRWERVLSIAAFVLGLGAVYNLLGFGSAFAAQEDVLRDVAIGLLMPLDPVIMAWAVPGIIIGHICRKHLFELDRLALAGEVISIVCLVLSFTKVGGVLPIFVRAIAHALSSA